MNESIATAANMTEQMTEDRKRKEDRTSANYLKGQDARREGVAKKDGPFSRPEGSYGEHDYIEEAQWNLGWDETDTILKNRVNGLYWVRLSDKWTVSEWQGDDGIWGEGWYQTLGLREHLTEDDSYFKEIGDRIPEPKD